MGTHPVSATPPTPDPGTEVVVPQAATVVVPPAATVVVAPTPQDRALVVTPTPQDRALVVADHPSCGCPPSIVSVAGHLRGCPATD